MLILIDNILKPMEIVFFSHSMNTHKPSDSTWTRFALSTSQTELEALHQMETMYRMAYHAAQLKTYIYYTQLLVCVIVVDAAYLMSF